MMVLESLAKGTNVYFCASHKNINRGQQRYFKSNDVTRYLFSVPDRIMGDCLDPELPGTSPQTKAGGE
jgi:hypothetical protein